MFGLWSHERVCAIVMLFRLAKNPNTFSSEMRIREPMSRFPLVLIGGRLVFDRRFELPFLIFMFIRVMVDELCGAGFT